MQLVDEVVLEQRVHELAAAVACDRLARLGFQLADGFDHVPADDRRIAPDRRHTPSWGS
jgi:hypothetical protein